MKYYGYTKAGIEAGELDSVNIRHKITGSVALQCGWEAAFTRFDDARHSLALVMEKNGADADKVDAVKNMTIKDVFIGDLV